jgi:hypothetical protein
MVKTLNLSFNDEDFVKLKEAKNGNSWEKFVLDKCLDKEEKE